jgi:hypothetical protein
MKPRGIVLCGLAVLLLTGCASENGYFTGSGILGIPGFFGGLFHGLITPLVLLPWLLAKAIWAIGGYNTGYWANEFQLYASAHTEGYPWGYFIGLLCTLSGGR